MAAKKVLSPKKLTFREVMADLKRAGTAQNVKIYKRHGASEPLFGVSFAHLGKLKKQIKVDHELALKLWASGNFDSRNLATMVVDPSLLGSKELDTWVRDLDSHAIVDTFVKVAAGSRFAHKKAEVWRKRKSEWTARAGWMIVASIAMRENSEDEKWLRSLIPEIQDSVHGAKNRVKDAMNYALIAIGGSHGKLRKKALSAADRIGIVEVDHGETGCKTRGAREYIEAMWARREFVAKKAQAKRKK